MYNKRLKSLFLLDILKNNSIKTSLTIASIAILTLVILAYIFSDSLFESERAESINKVDFNTPINYLMLADQ